LFQKPLFKIDVNVNSASFLAHNSFIYRKNRRAIAVMFVRTSVWDGRALWSYGALQRGFKFAVG